MFKGAKQVMEKCPDAISIFLLPPSFEELRETDSRPEHRMSKKSFEERSSKSQE
jgi:guanylate kinase